MLVPAWARARQAAAGCSPEPDSRFGFGISKFRMLIFRDSPRTYTCLIAANADLKTQRLSPAAARGHAAVTAESWEDKIHNAELTFSFFFSLHTERDQHCEFTGLHGVEPV